MNDYKIKIACHAIHTKDGKPYLLVPDGKGAAEAILSGYDCRAMVYESDACARIRELETIVEAFLDNQHQMLKRQEEMQTQIDWMSDQLDDAEYIEHLLVTQSDGKSAG